MTEEMAYQTVMGISIEQSILNYQQKYLDSITVATVIKLHHHISPVHQHFLSSG
jgi:hypothetical protein